MYLPIANKSFTIIKIRALIIIILLMYVTNMFPQKINIEAEISRYKEIKRDKLLQDSKEFQCIDDTIHFPNDYYFLFTDSIGNRIPYDIVGTMYNIFEINSSLSFEEILDSLQNMMKRGDNLSSPLIKERLDHQKKDLIKYVKLLSKDFGIKFKPKKFNNVIFENYKSNGTSCEVKLIEDIYVIFINDRLLDLSTWMTDMVFEMTVYTDSSGIYSRFINDSKKIELVKSRVKELINHYLFDCNIKGKFPIENTYRFREFIELFVLAHEFAHIYFNHFQLNERYPEVLNQHETRELTLNRWMNELLADNFALNIIMLKYYDNFDSNDYIWLLNAGAFYLFCIDIIERAKLIIEYNSAEIEKETQKVYENFEKLIVDIDPFPFDYSKNQLYNLDSAYHKQIGSLIDLSNPASLLNNPPGFFRANVLISSLNMAMGNWNSITNNDLKSLEFGKNMCEMLLILFHEAKEDLCEK